MKSADDTNTTNRKSKLHDLFIDGFGIDQKTLPSHRRKLCLENVDSNSENIYMVFPEKALGTQ